MDRHDWRFMHVLFVHKNFPAQFGHIASHLVQERGWECTFVSERPSRELGGVRTIQYSTRGGATESTHYASRTFEMAKRGSSTSSTVDHWSPNTGGPPGCWCRTCTSGSLPSG